MEVTWSLRSPSLCQAEDRKFLKQVPQREVEHGTDPDLIHRGIWTCSLMLLRNQLDIEGS
jgi:hypothetical protein